MNNSLTCFQCDAAEMVLREVSITGERNGEQFTVTVPGVCCPSCGFETVTNSQSGKLTLAISDAYRRAHSLLTSSDLKMLRRNLSMNQAQFADYIGVGIASIKRWECGQVQDRAMDELIRLKTDPEAALRNAHQLNPDYPILEPIGSGQVYTPHSNMQIDFSSLEESEILQCVDEPVAA